MDIFEVIDAQFARIEYLLVDASEISHLEYVQLASELNQVLAHASQTVLGDEQPCEDGLAQSPDNAVTSGNAETNDGRVSIYTNPPKQGERFEDEEGKLLLFSRMGGQGHAILHLPGEPDIQSSCAVTLETLAKWKRLDILVEEPSEIVI